MSSGGLRIHDAVEVEGGRADGSLAKHDVDLAAVVGLVVEEMADDDGGRVRAWLALEVGVVERPVEEGGVSLREELLDAGVFGDARGAEGGEVLEDDGVRGRVRVASFEALHPDAVAAEDVAEVGVDAAEGAGARFVVFGVVELRALFEEAFVGEAIVAGEHPEVGEHVHWFEDTGCRTANREWAEGRAGIRRSEAEREPHGVVRRLSHWITSAGFWSGGKTG